MNYLYYLKRIDFRLIPIILALMGISLLVISANTTSENPSENFLGSFLTPQVIKQIQFFGMGWVAFFICASLDYRKLKDWAWILYGIVILALLGLFLTTAVKDVHRWYRLPFIQMSLQPSDFAKPITVFAMSWFLERYRKNMSSLRKTLYAGAISFIPFTLIFKQPDLGTALIFYPVSLALLYVANGHRRLLQIMTIGAAFGLGLILIVFLDILPYESIKPYASLVLKEYQFKRLNPHTYHQDNAVVAIAIGGISGVGWKKSTYTARGWLPEPHTDSVFPAFGEEFGLLGLSLILVLFYLLIHCCFQVAFSAQDEFGRLVAIGISVYLATHVVVNIGMMSGLLPITGFSLVMVSYGGSAVISTMGALGILQSIYSRRFMF